MPGIFKKLRRRLRRQPFPVGWTRIIEKHVPYYQRLTSGEQDGLQRLIQIFLAEKRFEGCGGLKITDEIRVTIAAHACVLLLHRGGDCYANLKSIVVYPRPFRVRTEIPGPGGTITEVDESRTGESWAGGTVILSWSEVRRRRARPPSRQNLVLHEFAHQLDQEDGVMDGAPPLADAAGYTSWARILGMEYDQLRNERLRDKEGVIDEYGATDPAEFFAVITEHFFENPAELKTHHPGLYEELKKFYRQDPASRRDGN